MMDILEEQVRKLKETLENEIDRCNGVLQGDKVLELSQELDKLIREYLEVCNTKKPVNEH